MYLRGPAGAFAQKVTVLNFRDSVHNSLEQLMSRNKKVYLPYEKRVSAFLNLIVKKDNWRGLFSFDFKMSFLVLISARLWQIQSVKKRGFF